MSPIPTKLTIAPRGHSWHGQKLQKDLDGLPCRPLDTTFTPLAEQSPGDSLAAPAEAQQGAGPPTLEQFQRWLETEAHRAYHDPSVDVLHLVRCRAATMLLMQFKAGA